MYGVSSDKMLKERWFNSYVNRHGVKFGKCKECGGSLIRDSKMNCLYCEKCGLLRSRHDY